MIWNINYLFIYLFIVISSLQVSQFYQASMTHQSFLALAVDNGHDSELLM